MLDALKDMFRRRALRKEASHEPTRICPLDQVKSAVTFIDVEDTSFNECKIAVQAFYREMGIKGEIFFFDFRRLTDGERLITSITTTVLKKDLGWYGRPSREKINLMLSGEPDMFISLIPSTDFPIEFMAKCSRARFKVGRIQLPGDTFDIVVNAPGTAPSSQLEVFRKMTAILSRIK